MGTTDDVGYAMHKLSRPKHSEIVAIVDALGQKGLCTKQILFEIMTELRHKNRNEFE